MPGWSMQEAWIHDIHANATTDSYLLYPLKFAFSHLVPPKWEFTPLLNTKVSSVQVVDLV